MNTTRRTESTGSTWTTGEMNWGATADARSEKALTSAGLGPTGTGEPAGTAEALETAGGVATGILAPARLKSWHALTSTMIAVRASSVHAAGSRTRRTVSHACTVSDGAPSLIVAPGSGGICDGSIVVLPPAACAISSGLDCQVPQLAGVGDQVE